MSSMSSVRRTRVLGQTYEENRVFNVIVALDPQNRNDIMKGGNLSLRTPGGTYILLRQIADIYQSAGRYQVAHLSTRFEFVINLKVAKALGIELPPNSVRPRRRGDRITSPFGICRYWHSTVLPSLHDHVRSRLRPGQLPSRSARQLPDQSTTVWIEIFLHR